MHVTTSLLRSDLDKPDESKNNSSLVSVLTRDNSYLSLRIQNYPICNVVGGNSYVALENTSRFVLTFAARRPTLIYFRFKEGFDCVIVQRYSHQSKAVSFFGRSFN